MNKLVLVIAALILLIIQIGLENLWAIPIGVESRRVGPDLLFILLVFVGMQANTTATVWLGLLLGIVSGTLRQPDLLGPTALGYLVGVGVILQMRNMVYRDSALTNAIACFVAGVFAYLTEALLIGMRGVPLIPGDVPAGWSATATFLQGFLQLAFTAAICVPISALLLQTRSLWGFPVQHTRIARM